MSGYQRGTNIDGEANDWSGWSVSLSLDGNILAIGAPFNNYNGSYSGQVRVYRWNVSTWAQLGTDIDGEVASDQSSGWSVSLSPDGSTLAIGAPYNDGDNGADSRSGQVRVYDLSALLSSSSFVLPQFNLYPNPAQEQFSIQLSQGLELQKVNIYSSLGQFISSTTKNVINTTHLSQGIYFVEIKTNQGKATKRIIVE